MFPEIYRLPIFLMLIFSLLYMAYFMGQRGLRLYLGRVVQLFLAAAALVGMLLLNWTNLTGILTAAWIFLLFGLFPVLVFRKLIMLKEQRRYEAATRLSWILRFLCWGRMFWLETDFCRAVLLVRSGLVDEADRIFSDLADRAGDLLERRHIRFQRIIGFSRGGAYRRAVEAFEQDLSAGEAVSQPLVLLELVRALGELGQAEQAVLCLEQAEAHPHRSLIVEERREARGFLFAVLGERERLERLLAGGRLPAWRADYLRARAALVVGDRETAGASRAAALENLPAGFDWWREDIQGLAPPAGAAADAPAPIPVSPQRLDALETLAAQRRLGEAFLGGEAPWPAATIVLLVLMSLIWLAGQLGAGSGHPATLRSFGAAIGPFIAAGQYWRLVTCTLLHADFLHLLFNGYAIYFLGKLVESIYGTRGFIVFFAVSALAGSLLSFIGLTYVQGGGTSLGSSGAAFGLLGAALILTWRQKRLFPPLIKRFYFTLFASILVFSVAIGIAWSQYFDNWAHGGGLAAGALLALVMPLARLQAQPRRRWLTVVSLVLVAVYLAGIAGGALNVARGRGYPVHLLRFVNPLPESEPLALAVPEFWTQVEARQEEGAELYFGGWLDHPRPGRHTWGLEAKRVPADSLGPEDAFNAVTVAGRDFGYSQRDRETRSGELVREETYLLRRDRWCFLLILYHRPEDFAPALKQRLLEGFRPRDPADELNLDNLE